MSDTYVARAEFDVVFHMKEFYRDWEPNGPEAYSDIMMVYNSLIDAGIRPYSVVFHPLSGFSLIFHTWRMAVECQIAEAKVLDILRRLDNEVDATFLTGKDK